MENLDMQLREVLSYFNFGSLPFTKEVPENQLLLLPSIDRALKSLFLLLSLRGIGVLTGKSGTGKSSLLRLLLSSISPSQFHHVYLCHTPVNSTEFYFHLSNGFGIEPKGRRASMFKSLKERIEMLYSSKRTYSLLIIDEAHLLSADVLQELRMLSNFSIDSQNLLTILLCGLEDLTLKFGLSSLEFLANSISVTIKTSGLPLEETFSYVEKRISDCGNSSPLFTKGAVNLIHQASSGAMRLINNIAIASLMKTFHLKQKQVETEHVQMVLSR
jgi:type II secretory pathway predicted ATPase ExeA